MRRFLSRAGRLPAAAAVLALFACTPEKSSHGWFAMDTEFSAVLYGNGKVTPDSAFARLERESARLEAIFSDFMPASALAKVNGRAGDTLTVDPELAEVLEAALRAAAASGGSFDVTLHRLKRVWGLASGDSGRVPAEPEIAAVLRGNPAYRAPADAHPEAQPPYRMLDGGRVVLLRDSLSLDLGGIAKGYTVDRMHALLDSLGFGVHLVSAGGDMRMGGMKSEPWHIGIRHPRQPDSVGGSLTLDKPMAVSTSGDYERFFIKDGVRYHHIFDPRTGRPARPYCSVTVVAPTSLAADGLSKPLFILGPKRSAALLAGAHAEAVWVRDDAGGLCSIASPGMAGKLAMRIPPCHDEP